MHRFNEDVTPREFRERFRVSPDVLDILEDKLQNQLQHPTSRNQSLSARDQIKIFLDFIGMSEQLL